MVTPADIDRLCAYLEISRERFEQAYLEHVGGKKRIRTKDEWCVFFASGCSVHPAKPDVCRAWPFFQGNLMDELSWQMAQTACPGINLEAGHAAFVSEGVEYLQRLNMERVEDLPNALNLERLLKRKHPEK